MADSILLDIQEVYNEVGTEYYFVQPTDNGATNVYKESKKKTYADPITINGMITFNPKEKELSDIGIERKVSVIFKVPCQTLIDTGIINLSDPEILKSYIKFDNNLYQIVNYVPRSLYQGNFLIYNFECKRGE